jgi:hypothetical protein
MVITPTQPKVPEAKIRGVPGGFSVGFSGSGEGPGGPHGVVKGSHGTPGTPWVSSPGERTGAEVVAEAAVGPGAARTAHKKLAGRPRLAAALALALLSFAAALAFVAWGDSSVSSYSSCSVAKGPGTSAGAFPIHPMALSLSGEDPRGPRRGARGSWGTPGTP